MRIEEKIAEVERYLEELILIMPEDFRKYQGDLKSKAACERYFEKIMESATDLAFLVIKDSLLRPPEDDKEAFQILAKEGIISAGLSDRLKQAKGMRNILAHEYGKVDDEIVFCSITEEIERDVREFIGCIRKTQCD